MVPNVFLTADRITAERLEWISESIEVLGDAGKQSHPVPDAGVRRPLLHFFLTGEAIYSLIGDETRDRWTRILASPLVRVTIDPAECALIGKPVHEIVDEYRGRLTLPGGHGRDPEDAFWDTLIEEVVPVRNGAPVGFLHMESPYMYRSAVYLLRALRASIRRLCAPELYAYLDGIHLLHADQRPSEFENIGEGLLQVGTGAREREMRFRMIGCSRCATARGYVLVTDGGENYFSNCTIPAVAIRNLEQIVERLRLPRPVLGITSIIQQAGQKVPADPFLPKRGSAAPPVPVTILITKSPYATEHTFGALSLAILAAHKEILTRVIFIEDGVYALYGSQFVHERDRIFNIQDIVTLAGEEGYMELYAFTPSFEQRGIEKNPRFERILDIGSHELGKLLFGQDFAPDGGQHRVFFF